MPRWTSETAAAAAAVATLVGVFASDDALVTRPFGRGVRGTGPREFREVGCDRPEA